jgi:hypothetical protein
VSPSLVLILLLSRLVDGRVVAEAGRVLMLDEDAIVEAARRHAPGILARTGLAGAVASRWPVV